MLKRLIAQVVLSGSIRRSKADDPSDCGEVMATQQHSRWVDCVTQGRRARRYRVRFVGDEAVSVQVRVQRGRDAYWRECWHRKDGTPTITAACAIRAALASNEPPNV